MRDLDQLLFNFKLDKTFQEENFFISKSNFYVYELLKNWPNWEKKIVNIVGGNKSGKTHLSRIFLEKNKGKLLDSKDLNDDFLSKIKIIQNIVIDNFRKEIVNENLLYSLFDLVDLGNKFLVINSLTPISELTFSLPDLSSRANNCLIARIDMPDDELIFALVIKNFSDRQINVDKKIIDYIVKRIDRSYDKIFEFIYKINEISLKKKKPINLKIIKEVLEKKV